MSQSTDSPSVSVRLAIVLSVLATVGLLVVAEGNVAVALLPLVGGLAAVALWRLPMRVIALGVVFLSLLLDNPTERPGRGLYKSPLFLPGTFLYYPLSKSAHIAGMKLTGLELLVVLLSLIVGLRILTRDPVDGLVRNKAAAPFLKAALVAMGTLAALEVYGIGRGGSFPHSLMQMRTMFFMPFMTLFFAYAFKGRRDVGALLNLLLTVAILRALMCIYYYLTFMRHQGSDAGGESGDGSYVTTHSDSILAATALIICIVSVYQQPTLRALVMSAMVMPVVGLGVVFNNRRIAFVAVAMGFFFSYLAAANPFRRRVHLTVMATLPVLVLYVGAGWNAHGGWAKPVQSLRSVIEQKDTSSATRDIENYNLLETLKVHPFGGSGFGHEYLEKQKAYDISKIFEAYRYVPHNSVLWFWGAAGLLGNTLYWMFVVVGIYMAARVCIFAQTHRQAVMGMTAISAVCAYCMQCFGDMGLMSWMGSLIVSACLGICASMAVQLGGWTNGKVTEVPAPPLGVNGVVVDTGGAAAPGLPPRQGAT